MANSFSCPSCGAALNYPGSGESMLCPFCNTSVSVPAELRAQASQPGSTQMEEVARLSQSGQKIPAIKLYREITGVGLAAAKTAVEAMDRGARPPASAARQSNPDMQAVADLAGSGDKIGAIKRYREMTGVGLAEAKAAVEAIASGGQPQMAAPPSQNPGSMAEVARLAQSGQKIAAIKLYREMTGTGLAEAKNAVEAMVVDPGGPTSPTSTSIQGMGQERGDIAGKKGCLGILSSALILGIMAAAIYLSFGGTNLFVLAAGK